jgi:hypothetical protein
MDANKHDDLIRNARDLYMLAQKMQKLMLEMYFNEFIDLDEEEKRLRLQGNEMPF